MMDTLPKPWHGANPLGYRNRKQGSTPCPPNDGKLHIVTIGNLTIVLIRDAAVVTRKTMVDGKTYRERLRPGSPDWKRAVAYARTHTKSQPPAPTPIRQRRQGMKHPSGDCRSARLSDRQELDTFLTAVGSSSRNVASSVPLGPVDVQLQYCSSRQ
jgi:hypothetical protein